MLKKKTDAVAARPRLSQALASLTGGAIDRRTFLKRSGLAAGGVAMAGAFTGGMVRKAPAASPAFGGEIKTAKSICTHCSVGCTVIAEVQNGVWTGQEPGFDSPLNLGRTAPRGPRSAN